MQVESVTERYFKLVSQREYQICNNCVMDTSDIYIKFDKNGVCDHCFNFYNFVKPSWNEGEVGRLNLELICSEIKKHGKGKDYDCILGLSGGVDSSYMLHLVVKEFGLRPLVFHVDGGWNSEIAVSNINNLIDKLNLDLFTEVVNWNSMRDFQLAFFKAGVPHLDVPQDHAFVSVLYKYAEKHKIKYIFNGENISTEGVQYPLHWIYYGTDIRHINDIIKKFCKNQINLYPFSSIFNHKIYLRYFKGIKVIKPLNYISYRKSDAILLLEEKYNWKPYKQKHYESRFTKFYEGYWLPKRFGFDKRRADFSSLILTGQMARENALNELSRPSYDPETINDEFNYIATKLEITSEELMNYLTMPKKFYWDYKNIKFIFNIGARIYQKISPEKVIKRRQ